ncbi:ADP-ribose pyrophosphatase [Halomonadaceae bacterium LMG 33818]|uniref:NUDIX domain-containing protein n=1 Tax=Cernens ardua TaxID=3402176 RepID=UPI003EDBCC9B
MSDYDNQCPDTENPESTGHGTLCFTPADVKIEAVEPVYQGFFTFEKITYQHKRFDGKWSQNVVREVQLHQDAVGVLLYDPDRDNVVLVEQIRAGVVARQDQSSPWLLEVVAGLIDTDETPEEVARREAMEEAGCEIRELFPLYSYYPSPGSYTERVHLFCGLLDSTNVGGVHGLEEEQEDIRVHVIPFPQAQKLLQDGKMDNGMIMIAMLWLIQERASLRARMNHDA